MEPASIATIFSPLAIVGMLVSGLIGALVSLQVAGIWKGFKRWSGRRGRIARDEESRWKDRLNSSDQAIRESAFHELIAQVFYRFLLGNMLVAASGAAWIGDFIGFWPFQSMLVVVVSIWATFYFLSAAKWLRRYASAKGFSF